LKINDEHDALSIECPTYIRTLEEEKKELDGLLTNSNYGRR